MPKRATTQRNSTENSRIWCRVSWNVQFISICTKIPSISFLLLFFADFPDIQSDQRRLEHVEALTGVLRSLLDPNVMPNATDFLAIYGRVNNSIKNICDLDFIFWYFHCRWSSTHLIFWIRKWTRLRLEFTWAFRSLTTAVCQMLWRRSMAQHFSFAQYKICHPSIGQR